jgi:hypothetical protein
MRPKSMLERSHAKAAAALHVVVGTIRIITEEK